MKQVFLLIGTQKAGTTSLYHIFKNHPEINLANVKESQFFFDKALYEKGLAFYENSFFDAEKKERPFLDIDPNFIYYDFISERIHAYLGQDVKFILVLRDPSERAYSHYLMEKGRGNEKLSFEAAIEKEFKRVKTEKGNFFNSYLHRSLYARQLKAYLRFYSRDQFKIFLFEEDFVKNRQRMVKEICDFMGITSDFQLELEVKANSRVRIKNPLLDKAYLLARVPYRGLSWLIKNGLPASMRNNILPGFNKMVWKLRESYYLFNTSQDDIEPLTSEMRQRLIQDHFLSEIEELEQLIQKDLSAWKK